jgi:hypothetical protein
LLASLWLPHFQDNPLFHPNYEPKSSARSRAYLPGKTICRFRAALLYPAIRRGQKSRCDDTIPAKLRLIFIAPIRRSRVTIRAFWLRGGVIRLRGGVTAWHCRYPACREAAFSSSSEDAKTNPEPREKGIQGAISRQATKAPGTMEE